MSDEAIVAGDCLANLRLRSGAERTNRSVQDDAKMHRGDAVDSLTACTTISQRYINMIEPIRRSPDSRCWMNARHSMRSEIAPTVYSSHRQKEMKRHACDVLLINCQWAVTGSRVTAKPPGLPNGILEIATLSPVNDTIWLSAHQIAAQWGRDEANETPIWHSSTSGIGNFHLRKCQEKS